MLKRILAIILSLALFLSGLVFFAFMMIPLESLSSYAEHKLSGSKWVDVSIGEVEREDMGTFIFSDIEIDIDLSKFRPRPKGKLAGLTPPKGDKALSKPGKKEEEDPDVDEEDDEDDEGDEGDDKQAADSEDDEGPLNATMVAHSLQIDELRVAFSPWDLLSPGAFSVDFALDLMGGTIDDAELWFSEEFGYDYPRIYVGNIEDLDLKDSPVFAVILSFLPSIDSDTLTGRIESGSILLQPVASEVGDEEAGDGAEEEGEEEEQSAGGVHYEGEISLHLSDLVAVRPMLAMPYRSGKKLKIDRFAVTDVKLGECDIDLKIGPPSIMKELNRRQRKRDGMAILVTRMECRGESVDYSLRKGAYMRIPKKGGLKKARVNAWLKMAFSASFFDEKIEENGIVVTENDKLGNMIKFASQQRALARSMDLDGYFWRHCTGSFARPRCKGRLPPEEKRRKEAEKERKKRERAAERKAKREALKKSSPSTVSKTKRNVKRPRPSRDLGKPKNLRSKVTGVRRRPGTNKMRPTPSRPRNVPAPPANTGAVKPEDELDEEEPLDGEEPLEDEELLDGEEPLEDEELLDGEEPLEDDELLDGEEPAEPLPEGEKAGEPSPGMDDESAPPSEEPGGLEGEGQEPFEED